jgi:hypothetical protein
MQKYFFVKEMAPSGFRFLPSWWQTKIIEAVEKASSAKIDILRLYPKDDDSIDSDDDIQQQQRGKDDTSIQS